MNIFRPLLTIFIPLLLGVSACLLGASACYGQTTDTATPKPGIFKRLQQLQQQRMQHLQDQVDRQQEDRERLNNRPLTAFDTSRKWSLSFNAPGLLELQLAVGLGIGYQITRHWQLWVESSWLGQLYASPPETCFGGIREIVAIKYYFGPRQSLFFAGEFRWKQVYYHDVQNFYNGQSNTTLNNYTYTLENIIFGGAAWFGGRIRLSNNHRWRLEPSIGFGLKSRTVSEHDVPSGYQRKQGGLLNNDIFSFSPRDEERLIPYLPASVRLVYVL